jgi:hypothetical protein
MLKKRQIRQPPNQGTWFNDIGITSLIFLVTTLAARVSRRAHSFLRRHFDSLAQHVQE